MPPRTRKLKAVEPPTRTAPDLRASVEAAAAAMQWVRPTDQAMVDLALAIADQIEKTQARAEELDRLCTEIEGDPGFIKRLQKLEAMCEAAKVIGWLGPQLQGVLRDLGGAPAARKALGADQPVGGRLAELRARAAQAAGARTADPPAVDPASG